MKISNNQVLFDNDLINTGRFMLHGTPTVLGNQFEIKFSSDAPAAGFSISGSDIEAIPVEEFLAGKTQSYLLAVGVGLSFQGKLVLGRRPKEISVSPDMFTVAGGRCSEDPSRTAYKELAEEFVILASNGDERAFVSFVPSGLNQCPYTELELRELQTHAVESLPYSIQAKATHWVDGDFSPQSFSGEKVVSITDEYFERAYLRYAHPCVIESIKTIDILLPHELTLPEGWEIEEVYFVEHPQLTSKIDTPENFKAEGNLTAWAEKLVDLHIEREANND